MNTAVHVTDVLHMVLAVSEQREAQDVKAKETVRVAPTYPRLNFRRSGRGFSCRLPSLGQFSSGPC
jgi:hypothetical protein